MSTKSQAPAFALHGGASRWQANSKEYPDPNEPNSKNDREVEFRSFGHWLSGLIWSLGFGIWDFKG